MTRSLDAGEDGDGKMVVSCKHTHQHQFSAFLVPICQTTLLVLQLPLG